MAIHFTQGNWDRLKADYRKWRDGTLGRPMVPVVARVHAPSRPCPDVPLLTQATCHELSIPAIEIIDRIDWELSQLEFLGDAFPYVNFDTFGPGILGAFLGAELDNSSGRVWFHPPEDLEIGDLHFEFDESNIWFRRIIEVYEAAIEYWGDSVVIGLPDLGGPADILSTFRPGDKLLYDLYDHPSEVKRLIDEIHDLWFEAYNRLHQLLERRTQGFTDWSGIFQSEPGYMVQCDFCYMIGPEMFDEFIKPDLQRTFRRLPQNFYHLDGVGQLPHLDSLLEISELRGIQWVPGAGQPEHDQWPEVYERIAEADKLIQIYGGIEALERAALTTNFAYRFHMHQTNRSKIYTRDEIGTLKRRFEKIFRS